MGTNITKLREARHLTLEYVANKLGVTEIELKRIEKRWDNPSPIIARDLAVLLNCNVYELIGIKPQPEEWADWPYAISDVDGDEFGGIYMNIAGKDFEYAISDRQSERITRQMRELGCLEKPHQKPWINTETLCGRFLHINPAAVRSITLKHDDDEATPYYAHPEVYLALLEYDCGHDRGPVLEAQIEKALSLVEGEGNATEDQQRLLILYVDGSEDHRYLNDPWIATALLSLDAQSYDLSPITFLHVEREGGYVNGWINMAHVAMLSIPMERYQRLTAPE